LAALPWFTPFTTGAELAAPLVTNVDTSTYQVRAVVYWPQTNGKVECIIQRALRK
jgi:hypothetical protein